MEGKEERNREGGREERKEREEREERERKREGGRGTGEGIEARKQGREERK